MRPISTNIPVAETSSAAVTGTGASFVPTTGQRWTSKTAAWLGVGASPGALILGASIAERHGGPVPILSVILGFVLMGFLLWYQGAISLAPPLGEGGTLNEITPRYFGPLMQRAIGAVLALGMIGWFGFNVGLGGAALSALLHLPGWGGPVLIGLPILGLSLRGLKSWNGLATMATVSALVLVALVVARLAARTAFFTIEWGRPAYVLNDAAAFIGYVAVFAVRAPDFSAGLATRKDLAILVGFMCGSVVAVSLAGVGLGLGTGSADLVGILAGPEGLAIGNLLVAAAVIAPVFTTLYSGAPALKAATGLDKRLGMIVITAIGLGLAIARFHLWLASWLVVLAAMLPSPAVALAVEAARRRRGGAPRLVPLWVWVPGSLIAMGLTVTHQAFAALVGLSITAIITGMWCCLSQPVNKEKER